MNITEFLSVAFPPKMRLAEAERSIAWQINRWIGLRFAYCFYSIGVGANMVSVLRIIIAFLGLYFLSRSVTHEPWLPMAGMLLLALQVNLDFADGALARIGDKANPIGNEMDGLGNTASRLAIIVLFGYYTGSSYLLWGSVFSGFVLSPFWDSVIEKLKDRNEYKRFSTLFRLSSSVVFMLIILPVLIVLFSFAGLPLHILSYMITLGYIILALLFLAICCR